MSAPKRSLIPYACLYIDSTWSDLLSAYLGTFTTAAPEQLEALIAKKWYGDPSSSTTAASPLTSVPLTPTTHARTQGRR
jgi:hypothetical protein